MKARTVFVHSSTASGASVSAPRPLLLQSSRGIRREDPDHEVDQPPDDQHLDRQREEHSEEHEREAEQPERYFEYEQPADGEQADHEDGAQHGAVSRTGLTQRTRAEEEGFHRHRATHPGTRRALE